MNFVAEIWRGYRPYAVKLTIDFLVSGSIWVGLFFFQLLRQTLPINSWGAILIDHLHSAGAVAAFVLFTWWSIVDIILVHRVGIHDHTRDTR
jgi:hypothetical protein